jgi:uncharacterized membrane protein YbjE (DUF340 family)
MQTLTAAVLPILLSLAFGYAAGRVLSSSIRIFLTRLITPLVWLLLFSVGHQFGDVLRRGAEVQHVLILALLLAVLTTAIPWMLIVLVRHSDTSTIQTPTSDDSTFKTLLKPLKECAVALLMVVCGVLTSIVTTPSAFAALPFPTTTQLLYTLIFLVGLDMVGIEVSSKWLSLRTLAVPPLVVIGSLLGGAVASKMSGQPLAIALALSSGFGWFTLSGVLVAKHLGNLYGTVALLTDLFRELLAIILLYSVGARFSRPCIGASGATALDSTLPIIKQTCRPIEVPTALFSGLILTLVAPFLITFFLAS